MVRGRGGIWELPRAAAGGSHLGDVRISEHALELLNSAAEALWVLLCDQDGYIKELGCCRQPLSTDNDCSELVDYRCKAFLHIAAGEEVCVGGKSTNLWAEQAHQIRKMVRSGCSLPSDTILARVPFAPAASVMRKTNARVKRHCRGRNSSPGRIGGLCRSVKGDSTKLEILRYDGAQCLQPRSSFQYHALQGNDRDARLQAPFLHILY